MIQNTILPVRWGIIGAGGIAKRFCASLAHFDNSRLYAISGRSKEKMAAFQKEFPCDVIYTDFDALIQDENVDAIYLALPHEKESICLETWPEKVAGVPMGHIAEMDRVVSVISKLRELKNDNGLKPSRRLSFILKDLDGNVIPVEENQKAMIDRMAKSDWVDHLDGDLTVATVTGGSIYIPSQELLDVEEEKKKLTSERERLEGEVARSTKILSNPGFLAKAPAAKVEAEKAKLADYEKQLAVVIARFEAIAK